MKLVNGRVFSDKDMKLANANEFPYLFSKVDFKKPNLNDNKKTINKLYRQSKKGKANFFIIEKNNELIVSVKYKRRYKYLGVNDLASIIVSQDDHDLGNFIFGKDTNNYIRSNAKRNSKSKLTLDLSNGFNVFDQEEDITISYLTQQLAKIYQNEQDPYSILKSIWTSEGIFRTKTYTRKMSNQITKNFFTRLKKIKYKKIGDKKIEQIKHYSKYLVKIVFTDNSFILLRKANDGLKITITTHATKDIKIEDMVVFEKQASDWIVDNTEEFTEKHFSWKGFLKYTIFMALIVGTLVFTFMIIYKSSNMSLYSLAGKIANSQNRGIWFSLTAWTIASKTITAWKLKRMLMVQGQKVKIRHLFVSGLMGSIVSFVTPFTIGGDAIGYWYLRRKGFARGPLASTFISDTLLFQAKFTLQTVILMSIGWPIYQTIFMNGDPNAHAALIWFIIGTSWTVFATFMIFALVLWKGFQEWIVLTSVKLLEWTRFVNFVDPVGLIANYQYEFKQMRIGMKTVWGNWHMPIELMIYSLAPLFFSPSTILFIQSGLIHNEVAGVNGYMATIVVDDIIGTANSMSITPGGSGTGEWLIINTRQFVYGHKYGANPQEIASSIDFMTKMLFTWPWLLISALLIPTIIGLENRRMTIAKLNKNEILNSRDKTYKTNYKKYIAVAWTIFSVLYLIYFVVIF